LLKQARYRATTFIRVATLACITIDCVDSHSLAPFWSGALGWDVFYDEDDGACLKQADGPLLLYLQTVPEAKSGKNRVHVDLVAEDWGAEVTRLEALGATKVRDSAGPNGKRSVVMADPQGNEFCLTEA
jgi:predicted enzyme related to lactoylglutathione lyase